MSPENSAPQSSDETILKARNLTKIYSSRSEEITAVDHINLDLKRGEIFSLLGPNGAGKTTTFRMITTLEAPTEGELFIAGYDVKDSPDEVRKKIGLVPQGKSLYEKLTAEETMDMMGSLYGIPEDVLEERMEELLELVGLEERRNSLVKSFSGGMKQRLSLASGLIHHPSLLLLDEPTTGLDPQTRRKLWDLMRDLNEEGVTVFINTHIMEEAEALSDRVGIMHRGRLVEVDSPQNLKRLVKGGDVIEASIDPGDREAAKELLKEQSIVENVDIPNGKMRILTEDRTKALSTIPQLLCEENIDFHGIEVHQPTLEDVFIELTEEKHEL